MRADRFCYKTLCHLHTLVFKNKLFFPHQKNNYYLTNLSFLLAEQYKGGYSFKLSKKIFFFIFISK